MPAPAGCRPRSLGSLCTAAKAGAGWHQGRAEQESSRGGSALQCGQQGVTRACTFRSRDGNNQASQGPTPSPDQQQLPPTSGCPVSGLVKPSLPLMPRMVPKMRADSGKLAGSASGSGAAAAAVRSMRRGSSIKPCMAGSASHATNRSHKTEGNRHQADLHSRPGGAAAAGR